MFAGETLLTNLNPVIAARDKMSEATCLLELLADAEENNPARYFPITLIIERLKLADEDLATIRPVSDQPY